MLDLLQYEHFRQELASGPCARFIDDQQLLHWQHYHRLRTKLFREHQERMRPTVAVTMADDTATSAVTAQSADHQKHPSWYRSSHSQSPCYFSIHIIPLSVTMLLLDTGHLIPSHPVIFWYRSSCSQSPCYYSIPVILFAVTLLLLDTGHRILGKPVTSPYRSSSSRSPCYI